MKTSIQQPSLPSALFRIAVSAKHLAVLRGLAHSPTPFADLMLYPEKLNAVLATPRRVLRQLWQTPSAPKQPHPPRQASANPLSGLVNTEFHLAAPAAKSVKLAADFTDWEKSPLDLIRAEDGDWFTVVPLLPGNYAYHFIVDGRRWEHLPLTLRPTSSWGAPDAMTRVT
jgi:hypothetical protein